MQTDSHMDFSDNFDVDLIKMFHLTENDYAVLSTYVTDIAENNKDPTNVPNLCMVEFTSSIRNWGTKECNNLRRPKLTNGMWLCVRKVWIIKYNLCTMHPMEAKPQQFSVFNVYIQSMCSYVGRWIEFPPMPRRNQCPGRPLFGQRF